MFSLYLICRLTWSDARLTMFNLNGDENLNTIPLTDRQDLWVPEMVFFNTEEKRESLNDHKAFATTERLGDYELSRKQQIRNAYIYKGIDNPITISRYIKFNK